MPFVHGASAAVMFLILAFFSYGFYRRTIAKTHGEAKLRAAVYALCCLSIAIAFAITALAYDGLFGGALTNAFPNFTYIGEAVGLVAFGISWPLASHVLPGFTRADERFSPLSDLNPA